MVLIGTPYHPFSTPWKQIALSVKAQRPAQPLEMLARGAWRMLPGSQVWFHWEGCFVDIENPLE